MVSYIFQKIKRASRISIYLILFSFLCACFYSPSKKKSVYYNDRIDLLVLFHYSVPLMAESLESVGDIEIYPIDVDDYGRTLGIMKCDSLRKSPLFGENEVYCVLQSGSKTESCFYEDYCCVIVENGSDDYEIIERLKLDNDWDLPLDIDKCRRIPIKYYAATGDYDTDYGYNQPYYTQSALKAARWSSDDAWLDVLCKDGCGRWLFVLEKNTKKADSPICLIMMKEGHSIWGGYDDSKMSVIGTHILENRSNPWEEIHAFKDEMGWEFVQSN